MKIRYYVTKIQPTNLDRGKQSQRKLKNSHSKSGKLKNNK